MPKQSVYLDYAAATPMSPEVLAAMQPYFKTAFYNPSATYDAARKIKQDVEQARSKVASIIGAKSSEIIFTAGGTEANNLAIKGVMEAHVGANLVISAIEHPSIYEPAKDYDQKVCAVDRSGLIDLKKLTNLIDDKTVLVSIMYVNNEIGVIQPLSYIARIIKAVRADRLERGLKLPIYFHSDACQAANYLDLHTSKLGVDLMTINGGKIYGPKQSGALFIKSDVRLKALIEGGGQERNLRSGTENVAAIVGLSLALEQAQYRRKDNSDKLSKLQADFIDKLSKLEGATINGSLSKRIVNNVHVTFDGVDNEWLLIKLDELGVMAAAGSACSAANTEPSSVLKAIGLSDDQAQSSVRFSLGNQTQDSEISYVSSTLKKLLS
ncbi:MAG: cysteine desulfurase family protein [Candidatus Saccharibacteria bacterium]